MPLSPGVSGSPAGSSDWRTPVPASSLPYTPRPLSLNRKSWVSSGASSATPPTVLAEKLPPPVTHTL